METIVRRAAPEEPAAEQVRSLTVKGCCEDDEGSEVRATAVLVAEPTGALGTLAGVPVADPAEAQSMPRAPESVMASEEVQLRKSTPRPRSTDPALSPTVEVRAAGEPASASDASALSQSRAVAVEIPSGPRFRTPAYGALQGRSSVGGPYRTAWARAPRGRLARPPGPSCA